VRRFVLALAAATALLAVPTAAHEVPASPETRWIDGMGDAAKAWLAAMGPARGAQYAFDGTARLDWHFVPRARPGVALREMTAPQRAAAAALLRAGLSAKGAERAEAVMALESVLAALERSGRGFRDPANYAFAVFGAPGTPPWGWRVEGHHLSVNVTVAARGHAALTPCFTGSHPARVPFGPGRGARLHEAEIALGLALVQSLDANQLARALLQERSLGNVVAGPGRADALARPQGLPATDLTAPQQERLLALVGAYVGLAKDEWGRAYLALVRADLERTRFAWAGGRREGTAFYYRIHGPRILIEFDNTQNDANHVHSLWRDPANDFGRDDLGAHYANAHALGVGR
jgi:hypothetical protein